MRDKIDEVLAVLSYSRMTTVLIILGFVAFLGVHLLAYILIGSKTPTGAFAALVEPVYEMVGHRYDKLAWIGLFSFWIAAYRRYRKDRKRLFDL